MNVPARGIQTGSKDVTTAGTPEVLAASTAAQSVVVRAKTGNTDVIYIMEDGGDGFPLAADEGIELRVRNLAAIMIDAEVNGEGVHWVAEVD